MHQHDRRNAIRLGLSLALVGALAACAPPPSGSPAGNPSPGPTAPGSDTVPGGYTQQDPADTAVQAAATKAVELLRQRQGEPQLTLKALTAAATQVVAGLNYDLTMTLQTPQGDKQVRVVLYRNLEQEYTLTTVEGL